MNSELSKVTGKVESVGMRFNGSLKVNGTFYNFKKGFTSPVSVGDMVTISLEPWNSGNKSGVNIVGVVKVNDSSGAATGVVASKPVPSNHTKPEPKQEITNWAAKDRSQLVGGRSHDACELVNVSLQTGIKMDKVLELYKEALVGVLKLSEEIK